MSKKISFRGIALTAVSALALSGMAVLPAQAIATNVTLSPTTGSEWAVTSNTGATFDVTASNDGPALTPTNGLLTWKVVYPSADFTLAETVEGTKTQSAIADRIDVSGTPFATIYDAGVTSRLAVGSRVTVVLDVTDETDNSEADGLGNDCSLGNGDDRTYTNARVLSIEENSFTISVSSETFDYSTQTAGEDNCGFAISYTYGNELLNSTTSSGVTTAYVTSNHLATNMAKTLVLTRTNSVVGGAAAGVGTTSASVTAWVDTDTPAFNNDPDIDTATEYESAAQTISFVNPAEVVASTFTFDAVAGTQLSALTTTSPALNHLQSNLKVWVDFTETNLVNGVQTEFDSNSTPSFNTTSKVWTSLGTTNGVSNTAANAYTGYWSARPFLGSAYDSNTVWLRPASTGTVVATYVDRLTLTTTPSADVQAARVRSTVASNNQSVSAAVRVGTASVPVTATLTTSTGASLGAGKDVVISLAGTGFTVNGSTGPVVVKTDANGAVTATVAKTTPTTTGSATLSFKVSRLTNVNLTADMTLNWANASYTLYNLADTNDSGIDTTVNIQAGGSESFNLVYVDQWKVTAPADSYRLKVRVSGSATAAATTDYPASQAGASFTVTSNGTVGAGAIIVDITPEQLTSAVWVAKATQTVTVNVIRTVTSKVTVSSTAAELDADIQGVVTVSSFDGRSQNALRPLYEATYVILTGKVTDLATGANVANAKVTLSGDSAFAFSTGAIDKMGSITVRTNGSGDFTAWVYSNKSVFDSVVTITSGGASTTQRITFLPANTTTGDKINFVKAASSVKAGRTVDLSFYVADVFGNKLNVVSNDVARIVIQYSGPGFLADEDSWNQGQAAANFDNGIVTAKIATGAVDYGVGTVVVSYYYDGSLTVERDPIVKRHTFWIGPITNATAGAKKGRVLVDAYHAKGRTVSVYVGKTKVDSFVAKSSEVRRVVKGVKSGNRKVTVKISGSGKDFKDVVAVK